MSAQHYEKGGIRAQRGFLSQTYSLLFYLLVRFYDHRDLEAVIESSEGEDAKFSYLVPNGSEPIRVIELIQCKKRESGSSDQIHAGAMKGDQWAAGKITLSDLDEWVETKRPDRSAADLLAADADLYYTAIVFGELANKVSKFVPEKLRASSLFRWPSKDFSKDFPVNYQHKQDPVLRRGPGTQGVWRRVRVLKVASPFEMEAQCELLLRQLYAVSPRESHDIVNKLRIEIENRGVAEDEENRRLLPRDLEAILAQGRISQGTWRDSREFLERDELTGAEVNWGEPPRWIDFEKQRYIHRDEFEAAWAVLEREGRVVISGPAGTGKTTLCRFVAFRFLNQNSARRVYYLPVAPIESLQDEIEFLKGQIYTDTLFVIDDQHLAHKEVELLVQTFMDYQQEGRTQARLIVTSNINFTRTFAPAGGRRASELSQAPSIRLLPFNEDTLQGILSRLRANGLDAPITDDVLASLSEGNLGLALMLASCARELGLKSSWRRLFDNKTLGRTITDWILNRLGRAGDYEFFEDKVAPIFIIGSYGILVPEDFRPAVKPLHAAGFLENVEGQTERVPVFRPVNLRLAFIIDRQYNKQRVETAKDYLKRYPERLPSLCEHLAAYDYNLPTLKELFKLNEGDFIRTINDEPLSLVDVGKILISLYQAARHEGVRLLRKVAAPRGQPDVRFFSNFISRERAKDILSLENFFEATYRIDRYLVRQLADEQLGRAEADIILGLCELEDSPLDEIAACLHIIHRCSRRFATQLYDDLKQSPAFAAKIVQTDADPRGLSIWTRFCEEIRPLNRTDCYAYLAEHLPPDRVLQTILSNPDLNFISRLLFRLRRINPKMTAEIFSVLWQEHGATLERLLLNEHLLDALRAYLNALSRINRRLTIRFTYTVIDHLRDLVRRETRYRQIGATVQFLRSRTSLKIARTVLEAIDRQRVLLSMRQEDRAWDLVGRNLYDYAQISPDIAAWFEEHLDYLIYLRQIRVLRLQNLIHVIRGFLVAARPERKSDLLQSFLKDKTLHEELKHGWNDANNLTEIAFSLSLLRDIPLTRPQILTLLGIPNLAVLQEQFLHRLMRENYLFHIANGLFGIAKFDLEIAVEALHRYVEKVRSEAQPPETREVGGRAHTGRRSAQRRLPRGYAPNNIVDIGLLLQVAAAIEPPAAKQLATFLDLDQFAVYARDETNLGRLTVFMVGLRRASRKFAREFVSAISSEEIWERQFLENEEPANVLHYARELARSSSSKGREYVQFIFENHRDEIESFLEVEANLMLVSNWLRVLRLCDSSFAREHSDSVGYLLLSASELDTRLRNLLEATMAAIESDLFQTAYQLAARVLEERTQIRSVRRLHDWLELLHKSTYVGRELGISDFSGQLFSSMEGWHLSMIIEAEGHALLPAYTYHRMRRSETAGTERFKDAVFRMRSQILKAARDERYPLHKALALIFAEAPTDEIKATLETLDWRQPWEFALAALLFADNFSGEEPYLKPQGISQSEWQDLLQQEMNDHTNNLAFGLTLHHLAASASGIDVEKYRVEAVARAEDESVGAIKWLLRQNPGEIDLGKLDYYLWSILKATVFRSTYLSWERELESAVSSATFKQSFTRDLSTILQ